MGRLGGVGRYSGVGGEVGVGRLGEVGRYTRVHGEVVECGGRLDGVEGVKCGGWVEWGGWV